MVGSKVGSMVGLDEGWCAIPGGNGDFDVGDFDGFDVGLAVHGRNSNAPVFSPPIF